MRKFMCGNKYKTQVIQFITDWKWPISEFHFLGDGNRLMCRCMWLHVGITFHVTTWIAQMITLTCSKLCMFSVTSYLVLENPTLDAPFSNLFTCWSLIDGNACCFVFSSVKWGTFLLNVLACNMLWCIALDAHQAMYAYTINWWTLITSQAAIYSDLLLAVNAYSICVQPNESRDLQSCFLSEQNLQERPTPFATLRNYHAGICVDFFMVQQRWQ